MQLTLHHNLENPLATPQFEKPYREYNLKFKPQETPEGDFQAFVIVTIDLGYIHTCGSVTPGLPAFASQREAADAGWIAGRRWVDEMLLSEQEPSVTDASSGPPGIDDAPVRAKERTHGSAGRG